MAELAHVYDRTFDESEDAWAAFQAYRDQPAPRSALAAGVWPLARLKAWYVQHHWASRVVAWDRELDQAGQRGRLGAIEEMAHRHIELAKKLALAAEIAIDKTLADLGTEFGRLRAHEIKVLAETGMKYERLARGEATERVEGAPNYGALTDSELEALEAIAAKTRGSVG